MSLPGMECEVGFSQREISVEFVRSMAVDCTKLTHPVRVVLFENRFLKAGHAAQRSTAVVCFHIHDPSRVCQISNSCRPVPTRSQREGWIPSAVLFAGFLEVYHTSWLFPVCGAVLQLCVTTTVSISRHYCVRKPWRTACYSREDTIRKCLYEDFCSRRYYSVHA